MRPVWLVHGMRCSGTVMDVCLEDAGPSLALIGTFC